MKFGGRNPLRKLMRRPKRKSGRRVSRPSRGKDGEAAQERVLIEEIGHLGDGIAFDQGDRIYIPYTVPGDVLEIRRAGERGLPVRFETFGPDRKEPVCAHFSLCGGCSVQHLEDKAYTDWKLSRLHHALRTHDVIPRVVADLHRTQPGERRRVAFTYRVADSGRLDFGFVGRGSSDVIPVTECPVADPLIIASLNSLSEIARTAESGKGGHGKVIVTLSDVGLDVEVNRMGPNVVPIRFAELERLNELVRSIELARLSIDGEVLVQFHEPTVRFGDARVPLPQGAFLQAAISAETRMVDVVKEFVSGSRTIADLFSGVGTFTFPLARLANVHAVDVSSHSINALNKARDRASGRKQVSSDVRDLFHRPLSVRELEPFDCAIVDPPRAGAAAQVEQLAQSKIAKIAMISCNPATFARDARTLTDGGFELDSLYPLDQFLWSHHLELVGLFHRVGS